MHRLRPGHSGNGFGGTMWCLVWYESYRSFYHEVSHLGYLIFCWWPQFSLCSAQLKQVMIRTFRSAGYVTKIVLQHQADIFRLQVIILLDVCLLISFWMLYRKNYIEEAEITNIYCFLIHNQNQLLIVVQSNDQQYVGQLESFHGSSHFHFAVYWSNHCYKFLKKQFRKKSCRCKE